MSKYPALISALAQTILAFIVSVGSLTAGQAGVIEAAVAAGAGLVVACFVRPFTVSAVTGFINAGITVLVAFNVPHINAGLTSMADAFVLAVAAFFVHGAVQNKALATERAQARAEKAAVHTPRM